MSDIEEDVNQNAGDIVELPFALFPALGIQGVINFRTTEGRKIYKEATSKVSETLHNCQPENLFTFIENVADRAAEYGWDDGADAIVLIPEDFDENEEEVEYQSLIRNYGAITLDTIRAHAETYLFEQSRKAQNNMMAYKCFMNSLSEESKSKVLVHKDEYIIENPEDEGEYLPSAALLLKVIIRESHLDTNAKTSSIRTKLSSLDTYIKTVNSDITKFNEYVYLLISALNARGERTEDLLVNLFKGYKAATDKTFVSYIARKQEAYEEGQDIEPKTLMNLANERFKTLKATEEWNSPSAEQEQIIALTAEIATLKKKAKKGTSDGNKGHGGSSGNGGNSGRTGNNQKRKAKPQELRKPPKEGKEKVPIYWNNRTWHWCSEATGGKCNGVWRCHKPSECEGKAHKFVNKRKADEQGERKHGGGGLRLSKAMAALIGNDEEEE